MGQKTLIEISGLSFRYHGGNKKPEKEALSDINLSIREGEFVVITGPSGCGKSTFCKCLNGLVPHTIEGTMKGEVVVCGLNTRHHEVFEFTPHLGMVFQDPENQLFSNDVESEMAFGPENLGLDRKEVERRITGTLSSMNMGHLRNRQVEELSGGEKQIVAIASAMVLQPEIIVLDEPSSELDPENTHLLVEALQKLKRELHTTIILVEHRLDKLLGVMDRLIVFNEGKVVHDGNPETVFNASLEDIGIFIPPLVGFSKKFGLPVYRCVDEIDMDRHWNHRMTAVNGDNGRQKETVVSVKDLFYRYPGKKKNALNGVTMDFHRGEFTVIMGGNGSGKTTLVKHLNGLLRPHKGEVFVDGENLKGRTIAEAARKVGIVFQNASFQLFEESIFNELAFAPKNTGFTGNEITERVNYAAVPLKLDEIGYLASPLLLSGGEKQRVAIASVLTLGPDVIIMDEPTLGLDAGLKRRLATMLDALKGEDRAVIIVTHDMEFAATYAERVVLMREGEIIGDGNPRDVLTSDELVREASLALPQAAEIGKRLGFGNVLGIDEIVGIPGKCSISC